MADDHPIPAYPLMFDPSQFKNQYSPFAGKALPWPSTYYPGPSGASGPTDALGRPIQSYQNTQAQHDAWAAANPAPAQAPVQAPLGTRLDSNGNANAPGSNLNPAGDWTSLAPNLPGASPQAQANYAYDLGLGGFTDHSTQQAYMPPQQGGAGQAAAGGGGMTQDQMVASFTPQQQQWWASASPSDKQQAASAYGVGKATAAPAAPSNPYDMNQAYLDALARPGKVTTPGATVAQSAPPSNQSGVLNQFLANWDRGGQQTKGAGNYDNSGFINSLRGMV